MAGRRQRGIACTLLLGTLGLIAGCEQPTPATPFTETESRPATTAVGTVTANAPSVGRSIVPVSYEEPARTNRLGRTNSPYLLQHAHNPVDWYPWGPEALEKARRENKPIFLSIGYSTCHWCHVMERLVFTDVDIAAYLNEHFVCIKVDREERPDVDTVYMTGLLTYFEAIRSPQGGGWPLSLFLTPEGKPFMGGTYFPPKEENGRPGFKKVCEQVVTLWDEKQDVVGEFSDLIVAQMRRRLSPSLTIKKVDLDRELSDASVDAVLASFDPEFGGFGFNAENPDAPKFPAPARIALLQYHARRFGNDRAERAVRVTLDAMAEGGLYDHLAGGFHRYSTDREWRVPHFEKMLYDQAQLADVYTEAYRLGHLPGDRRVVEGTLDFVLAEMRAPKGGFLSAMDAETDGVEGAYYVWSTEELRKVLGDEDAGLFSLVYGFEEPSDFDVGVVLRRATPIRDIVRRTQEDPRAVEQRLLGMRRKLLDVRSRRPAPRKDDKVLTAWNGLAIKAFANAGRVLGREDYVEAAEAAAMFVLTDLRDDEGRLLRSHRDGRAAIPAYLEDHAFLVDGLLALHEATRDEKWFNAARRLTDQQIALYWDDRGKGFLNGSSHGEELVVPIKEGFDDALPAGNAVAVRNLLRIGSISGEEEYAGYARETIEVFAGDMKQGPIGAATMAVALGELLDDPDFGALNSTSVTDDLLSQADRPEPTPSRPATDGGRIQLVEAIVPVAADDAEKTDDDKEAILKARAFLEFDKLPAGGKCRVVFRLQVREGWHVNAHEPGPDYKIATAVSIKTKQGTKLASIKYPKGDKHVDIVLDETSYQYDGEVLIPGVLEIPATATGSEEIELHVRYQACRGGRCLRPQTLKLKGKLTVADVNSVKSVNDKYFKEATDE